MLKLIPIADIRYFEADQKYVRAWHAEGHDLIDDALKSLEQEFHEEFVRTHRSLLVGLRYVEAVEKTAQGALRVRLREPAQTLPVSRRHAPKLRARIAGRAP